MKKTKYNILIVEDEFINMEFVKNIVIDLGHDIVGCVTNIKDALDIAKKDEVDIAFMDINLEGDIDGILGAKLLNRDKDVAIIYMSAFGDRETILNALDTNIYGYLHKPFDIRDIESTLAIAIKRAFKEKKIGNKTMQNYIKFGDGYIYNISTKTLTIDSIQIDLTKQESKVLYYLIQNINQNLSYLNLRENVWDGKDIANSTIRDIISKLRKKTSLLDIVNIVGIGYCLRDA